MGRLQRSTLHSGSCEHGRRYDPDMAEQPVIEPGMYCRKCWYVLDGLTERRCPECGRPFDPLRRGTYRKKPKGWRRRWVMRQARRAAAVFLLLLVFGGVWVGWRYHSEQSVIARVKQLGGSYGLKPAGPKWLTDWVRRRSGPWLNLVTSVSFISGTPPQMTASIDELTAALIDHDWRI